MLVAVRSGKNRDGRSYMPKFVLHRNGETISLRGPLDRGDSYQEDRLTLLSRETRRLAEYLLSIVGVENVYVSAYRVDVFKSPAFEWEDELEPQIQQAFVSVFGTLTFRNLDDEDLLAIAFGLRPRPSKTSQDPSEDENPNPA